MGQWYCCNDSFISPSTVQEVLSEKVYILFFSWTNQSPGSDISPGTIVSNGLKSRVSNGNGASKTLKPYPGPGMTTSSKPDKVPFRAPLKFSIAGTSSPKGPSISIGKSSKKPPVTVNGDAKETSLEKIEKSKLIHTNGSAEQYLLLILFWFLVFFSFLFFIFLILL